MSKGQSGAVTTAAGVAFAVNEPRPSRPRRSMTAWERSRGYDFGARLPFHAVDVGPAAAEVGPAAKERGHRVADQREPVAHGVIGGRPAVHLDRAADPAEHGLVIGAQEFEPVVDARF